MQNVYSVDLFGVQAPRHSPPGHTKLGTAVGSDHDNQYPTYRITCIYCVMSLSLSLSFSLSQTFSMLALPCSKIHKMKGFVTMEKVILSILPMLWQVSLCLSCLLFTSSSLCPACLVPPVLSLSLSFLQCCRPVELQQTTHVIQTVCHYCLLERPLVQLSFPTEGDGTHLQ